MANQGWQIPSAGRLFLNDIGPIPTPGPKEVVVRIHAISLNYRDIAVVDHSSAYPFKHKENLIPGSDGAGTIEAAGSASRWQPGERVVIHPNTWLRGRDPRDLKFDEVGGAENKDGTLQRYMLCDEKCVFRAPESMTLDEASTLYTAGVTAYQALFDGEPKLSPDSIVLTLGTGGVSCYAIQIAATVGATVIATSSSDEKLQVARKLGAAHLITYRETPDWAAEARILTGGLGVDIVVDVVGDLGRSVSSLRHGGRVSLIGILGKDAKPVAITTPILFGAKTIKAVLGTGSQESAIEFVAFVERHQIHPPIAQTFVFEEADKALDAMRTMNGVGKIVITV